MPSPTVEQASQLIAERVAVFARHRAQYRADEYKEAQLRREFLDPFFEALGWDVTNRQGLAEQFKEVVNEDALKIAGTTNLICFPKTRFCAETLIGTRRANRARPRLVQRQIDATDAAIDALVCELYGVTEEERRVIENDPK